MNYSILSIGDELLIGKITNTNTSYIAKQLNILGLRCIQQMVVADNENEIINALNYLSNISNFIIVTGGLGLTDDDKTKSVITKYVGSNLEYNNDAEKVTNSYYNAKGIEITEQIKQFNYLPKNCYLMPNYTGVACGFIVNKDKLNIAVFPGPPVELIPMFQNCFIPYIKQIENLKYYTQTFKIFELRELEVYNAIKEFKQYESDDIYLTTYCSNMEVSLVMRYGENADMEIVDSIISKICNIFDKNIYSFANIDIEEQLNEVLKIEKPKIAIAESISGGKIADKLISIPGISNYLLEDIVCYSNESKINRLQVNKDTIDKYGVVSKEVAYEMCSSLLKNNITYAIATTGDAGPTTEKKNHQIGKCYIAIGKNNNIKVYEHTFFGNRNIIRDCVSKQGIFYLIHLIKYKAFY